MPVPRWVLNIASFLINGPVAVPSFILTPIGALMKFIAARITQAGDSNAPAVQAVLQSGFSKLWENIVYKECI